MRTTHWIHTHQIFACLVALVWFAYIDPQHARAQPDDRSRDLFAPDGGAVRRDRTIVSRLPWHGPDGRGAPFTSLSYRFGPEPRLGVVRHVADTRVGWLFAPRTSKVATALSWRSSVFAPDALQPRPAGATLQQTQVLMLEALTVLDLRDRVRSPRRGVYLRAGLQQAGFGGASSWDYLRATLEVRGYVPLGRGIVLAARFAAGGLLMLDTHGVGAPAAYGLDEFGPLSEQLQAGGISSHRGYRRGGLGARRRSVDAAPANDGSPMQYRPVLIAGGTRRWEGAVELRMRVSRKLFGVLFVDAGNVARRADLELGALNLAWGLGVRYRTKLGMLRAEWAFRPEALQRIGRSRQGEPRACVDRQDVDCRPTPMLLGSIPGAFHLAFAEPF